MSMTTSTLSRPGKDAMLPIQCEVVSRVEETHDTTTLRVRPVDGTAQHAAPGQFMMLYAFGVGEVAISVSGLPEHNNGEVMHTVRGVGAVSSWLAQAQPGTIIGSRGPFGEGWNVESAIGNDVVIVAGGVGLAPLRPVINQVLEHRSEFRRVVVISGARSPAEHLFEDEQRQWAKLDSMDLIRTIDVAAPGWVGEVGFVTGPLSNLHLDTARTTAYICGPDMMMNFCAQMLVRKGLPPRNVQISLERNMQCGVGLCGHCQRGELIVCRDGPVVTYDVAESLVDEQEL